MTIDKIALPGQILWSGDRRYATPGRMPYAPTPDFVLGFHFAPFASLSVLLSIKLSAARAKFSMRQFPEGGF
jgi:hypothetical protein